jgi:hypothetical protein
MLFGNCSKALIISVFSLSAPYGGDCEDPYPSLSDYHDYEPNLEFDDSDLHNQHSEEPDGEKNNLRIINSVNELFQTRS